MTTAASAQAEAVCIRFGIKASDTATALNSFARQAGRHVVFPCDTVADRRVVALRGSSPATRRCTARSRTGPRDREVERFDDLAEGRVETASTTAADIVVLGQGQSRQVQTVSAKADASADWRGSFLGTPEGCTEITVSGRTVESRYRTYGFTSVASQNVPI